MAEAAVPRAVAEALPRLAASMATTERAEQRAIRFPRIPARGGGMGRQCPRYGQQCRRWRTCAANTDAASDAAEAKAAGRKEEETDTSQASGSLDGLRETQMSAGRGLSRKLADGEPPGSGRRGGSSTRFLEFWRDARHLIGRSKEYIGVPVCRTTRSSPQQQNSAWSPPILPPPPLPSPSVEEFAPECAR